MKKYFKNLMILSLATAGFLSCESSNKTINDVFDEVTRGAVFRATSDATALATQEFSFSDPSSTWTGTFEVEDNKEGALLQNVEVYATFNDTSEGTSTEALVTTLAPSAFSPAGLFGLPTTTVSFTLGELASAVGLVPSDYTGGDSFKIRFNLNLTDGRSFSDGNLNSTVRGGAYFRSPFAYVVPLVCPPVPPTPGTWTIEMADSLADGWQTVGDGGPGITITLNDGTVFEVGMCSPYEASDYDCTPGTSSAVATIDIPVGTTTADWVFPGDTYGEISFVIKTPNGNVAADSGVNPPAGAIAIDFCVD